MKQKHISIFNLIEIFSQAKKQVLKAKSSQKHCEQKHHHDFYCDTEKHFVSL